MSKSSRRKAPTGCFWRGDVLYGRIQVGGQDVKWSLRTDDPKVAAARRKAERDREVAKFRYGDARRLFSEAMEAWASYIADEVSQKTVNRYATSLEVLGPQLDGLYVDEVDRDLVGEIVKWRRETPMVPKGKKHPIIATVATVRRDLTALSSVMDYCVDEQWRNDNPVIAWLKPGGRRKTRLKERRDPIVLPAMEHVQMVIDAAPGLKAKLIITAVKTGARYDELVKRDRADLDRARKQLRIIGKRNKQRYIDLVDGDEDYGWETLSGLPASIETKALFWHKREAKGRSRRGQQPAQRYSQLNFDRLVARVAEQAQKQDQDFRPFRFHDLRHLHAVLWLKSGRSIYVLQQRLGHTSVKTTEMYLAYLTPEEKQQVMMGRTAAGSNSGTGAAVSKVQK